ncbi:MAG: peptidoglycan DD-metalloendopeptidase family protein [Oscillospiraceae bacterium]|nr:peptidoglycan DD-metalloendopeptidase family protein [Oscillospiraceae bacterium]
MRIRNRRRRAAALLLLLALLAGSLFTPAAAAPQTQEEIEKELAAIEQRIAEQEKRIEDLKDQKADQQQLLPALEQKMADVEAKTAIIDGELGRLNASIAGLKAQVDALSAEIAACEAEIERMERENAAKEAQIKDMQLQLMARLREQYMNGPVSNLQLILSSPDLASMMAATEYVRRKAEYDKKLRDQLEAEMAQLAKDQEEQRKKQAELEGKRTDLQRQSAALVSESLRQREKKNQLEAQQDRISSTQQEIFGIIDNLDRQTAESRRIIEKEMRAQEEFERKLDALLAEKLATGVIDREISNDGKMIWPFPYKGCYISSGFGEVSSIRNGRSHAGIDITIGDKSRNYQVIAALDGVVVDHGFQNSMGNYVVIVHGYYAPKGKYIKTTYMHLATGSFTSAVVNNAKIKAGAPIGIMGSTGNSTGPHLHFQVNEFTNSSMNDSRAVNPLNYVKNTYG